jgi:hypothetical protein
VTAATFVVEVAAAPVDVAGSLAIAGVIVALADGKETSGFPDKIIQKLLTSVRADRRARPSTLARYVIGRVFGWHERTAVTGSSRDKE